MQILWRGDEYEFEPLILRGGKDKPSRFSNIDAPIFGADTESVQLADRYEPQCFTFSDPDGNDDLKYIQSNAFALEPFMQHVVGRWGMRLLDKGERHSFLFFHNLEYDWLQLIKNNPKLLEMVRIGVGLSTDYPLFRIGGFRLVLKKNALFVGSAPHFTIRIMMGDDYFDLHVRDTFSFFPSSLARVAKDLKLDVGKMDRQEDLGMIDYRDVPDRDEGKRYFEEYAKLDSRITRLAGERIRSLHRHAGMEKIRASAPGFAISLVYHGMTEEQAIVSGTRDESIMQLIFDTYRGGRTGGIYHGRVENISVLDFHSSYPASMLSLPSFGPDMAYIPLDDLSIENVLSILDETGNVFLRVSGREDDPHYPSLITTHNGKLTPIFGDFENIATTGVELLVGIRSGTLHISHIHECVVLLDMDEEPFLPFATFARHYYERKAMSEKGSTEYASAKLALNSAYGKLIESRNQTMVGAAVHDVTFPYLDTMEKDFGNYYYQKYLDAIDQGITLHDAYDAIMEELCNNFPEDVREQFTRKHFGDFSISGRIYGRNVVPAAASLITATSRARLCAGMKALRALYWDTDSLFVADMDEAEMNQRLQDATKWLPKNVPPLRIGDELGDLECEIKNASGFLAGTKRYYLKAGDKVKAAVHGIPALSRDEYPNVIEYLATGRDFVYESKPKPMKAKESKSVSDIGSFQSKRYRSAFHLDPRLQWDELSNGWAGSIIPFRELPNKGMDKHVQEVAHAFFGNREVAAARAST